MPENLTNEEDHHKRNVFLLMEEYGDKLDRGTIIQTYYEMRSRYKDARIRIYVPLFVMRDAKETLSHLSLGVRLS